MGEPARDRNALVGLGDPSPIDVAGRDPAVLAIHGFGGTPTEVELVTDVASSLGLRAYAPLLPGHGTSARELAKTRFSDWLGAANVALDRVVKPGVPAFVVGLSLGSLLAIHLAANRPGDVRALVLLANATRLAAPFPDWPLRFIDRFDIPDFSLPKAGADISDAEARRTHLSYGTQPVHAAIEVLRGGERAEALAGKIRCPTLIVHGKRDHVCPVENAARVARKLATADQRVVILPRSFHIVTRDVEKGVVRSELDRFLRRFDRQ
jgi:carboxylesterase